MREVRILVSGSRTWIDDTVIHSEFLRISRVARVRNIRIVIIEGECEGVDLLARALAELFGWGVLPFPAKWKQHGRAAGPIRNRQMITEGKPHCGLLFHHNIRRSKGTRDMMVALVAAGIRYRLVEG